MVLVALLLAALFELLPAGLEERGAAGGLGSGNAGRYAAHEDKRVCNWIPRVPRPWLLRVWRAGSRSPRVNRSGWLAKAAM